MLSVLDYKEKKINWMLSIRTDRVRYRAPLGRADGCGDMITAHPCSVEHANGRANISTTRLKKKITWKVSQIVMSRLLK